MSSFGLDPQIIAQLAAAGFRPPPPMQMAPLNLNLQMPNPGPQQQGGGIAGALGALGGMMPGIAKAFGNGPDGLPQSGLGSMTGNAAQNAVNQYGAAQVDPVLNPYSFLGGAGSFGSNWGNGGR